MPKEAKCDIIEEPWETFLELIQPSYYKGKLGNKSYPLELMLRIFILQNVYNLSDMAVMNEVIDSRAFSNFCGINSPDEVPNGDTIGRFRNILTRNGLQEKNICSGCKNPYGAMTNSEKRNDS